MRRESHVRICGGDGQEIGRLYPEIEDTLATLCRWGGADTGTGEWNVGQVSTRHSLYPKMITYQPFSTRVRYSTPDSSGITQAG